ncbi:chromate transporter [bacterium]|nr:chromate transporter [bacterium]
MDKKISLLKIFLAFLYSGLILLGGGYVILPILQTEIVKKRGWLTSEELTDYYAISQSLPGLIAINISILTGYKLRGVKGALSAVTGVTFFAFWAIVALSSVITQFTSNNYVKSAFWGIEIAVVILIISAIREMWQKSIVDIKTVVIYTIALIIMLLTNISPAIIILCSIFLGIGYKLIERMRGQI